jgi:serine/threonine-protein kinase
MPPLAAAHGLHVVHRDLKPGNLFIGVLPDGRWHVTVLDFGVAKQLNREGLTSPDLVLGTPGYMAPEQIKAQPVSDRTDIYAMGVVAWRLLTGALPFDAPSSLEQMRRQVLEPLPPFPAGVAPATLVTLIERMLSKRAADRPSAQEVTRALASIEGVQPQQTINDLTPVESTPPKVEAPVTVPQRRSRATGLAALKAARIAEADTSKLEPPQESYPSLPRSPGGRVVGWISARQAIFSVGGAVLMGLSLALLAWMLRPEKPEPPAIWPAQQHHPPAHPPGK